MTRMNLTRPQDKRPINKNPFTLSSLLAIVWILSYMKPRAQVGDRPSGPQPPRCLHHNHFGKQFGVSSKIKHKLIIQTNNSSPKTVPRKRKLSVHTDLYKNIPRSLSHNNQNQKQPEAHPLVTDKQKVLHPHNGLLFGHKRNEVLKNYYNMDKPQNVILN